jgi:hypothetical protein
MYRFIAIPIKIPASYFANIDELVLEYEKQKTLPNFKT